jgi:isoleucyl-tRNA synthetase
VAIAVHPDHEYALVRYADAGGAVRHVLLAEALVEPNFARAGITGWEKLGTVKGKKLEGRKYRHVFLDREGVVVTADYVTVGGEGRGIDESQIVNKDDDAGASDAASGAGTGLVHTAPGHGREDFLTGRKYGLPVLSPVDAGGRLTDAAGVFVGDKVFDADPKIVAMLRDKGVLFHHEPYKHQYPHCWRCKKPVIFRATDQWFVNVDHEDLRGRMAEQIAGHVRWFPEAGKNRIGGMVKQRPDWCISRQRHWGVAIPAFFNRKTGEGLIRADVVRHVRDLFARHGSGYWFEHTAKELLPPGFTHEGFTADDFEKDHAIFDVWFESGASHRAVLRNDPAEQFPADTYLEGSDQHRGWFQVSLITAMAADGVPPFRNVVTHGFVVDDKGEKMSKSAGNYISLGDALKFAGADLFRLWVSSIDYSKEINTSQELMKRVHDPYRTFRNTLRILFGNLAGFDPAKDRVPTERLTPIDRWAVSQLQGLVRECLAAYDGYQFFKVFSAVHQFCGVTLSSFYVDVLKDRMYCDPAKGEARRSSQTAMYDILSALIRLMAPVLVHTAEEAWTHFRALGGAEGPDALPDSVHLALLPEPDAALADPAGDARWERLLKVRGDANREIEKLRKDGKIGKSLEAAVTLHTTDPELKALLVGFGPTELGTVLMVSSVTLSDSAGEGFVAAADTPGLSVKAVPASGPKCVRCWNIRSDVGSVAKHPTLCKRCADVVG